jgi:hypothetical protein
LPGQVGALLLAMLKFGLLLRQRYFGLLKRVVDPA